MPLGLFADRPRPRLYHRIVEVLRVRHYSRRTEEAYTHWIRRYVEFHEHRHPRQLSEADVNRFLTHLAVKEHVAASTQNQALSAILFLYEHVLKQPLDRVEGVVRARRPKRLPVVLTADEVSQIMAQLSGDKWVIAMLLYGGGLRLLEALHLRIKDLDLERHEVTVRGGKGDKDRVTTMPRAASRPLREHLRRVQAIHQQDLADGYGRVELPYALDRKYPNANREWGAGNSFFPSSAAGAIRKRANRVVITSTNPSFRGRSRLPSAMPVSRSGPRATPFAIRSPRTC
ncbi:MAG: integron integrase, partial [Longimicrobiales bacterium]